MLDGQKAEAAAEAETASIFHSSHGLGGRQRRFFFSQAYFLACFDYAINYAMAKNFFAQT